MRMHTDTNGWAALTNTLGSCVLESLVLMCDGPTLASALPSFSAAVQRG